MNEKPFKTLQAHQENRDNFFDAVSLLVQFSFSYSDFERDSDYLVQGKGPAPFTETAEKEAWMRVSTVEHEYFHCRHLLSTSFGYFVFYLHQRLTIHRLGLLSVLKTPDAVKHIQTSTKDLHYYLCRLPDPGGAEHLASIYSDDALVRWIFSPNESSFDLASSVANIGEDVLLFDSKGSPLPSALPFLVNIRKPDSLVFEAIRSAPTIRELIEGIAMWKEYAYISQIALRRCPHRFKQITEEWVISWEELPTYRRAADFILERTGCNLAKALPGVLLDIAFQGAFMSPKPKTWHDVLPQLRLLKMVEHIELLPKSFLDTDSCTPLNEDFYKTIENIFCEKCGWPTTIETLQDIHAVMRSRNEEAAKQLSVQKTHIADLLAEFYDMRFSQTLSARIISPGTYLFPWTNPQSNFIGGFSRPVASFFTDTMVVNTFGAPEAIELLYFSDIVTTAFLDAFFDNNITDAPAQKLYRRARYLYSRSKEYLATNYSCASKVLGDSFDDFITRILGHDYRALRQAMHGSEKR
jgi:hypothetical protein